jgi:hypothetical protein
MILRLCTDTLCIILIPDRIVQVMGNCKRMKNHQAVQVTTRMPLLSKFSIESYINCKVIIGPCKCREKEKKCIK